VLGCSTESGESGKIPVRAGVSRTRKRCELPVLGLRGEAGMG
jgi:hypothetical protein